MSTRSRKHSNSIADGPQLNHIESLLIAQAAWEMGTASSSWPAIAKVLSKHPLVTRPKSFFTAQSCHSMYNSLLHEAGLEANDESSAVQSATNLALAKKYFQLRYNELRDLISAEENAFKTILKEIEDIKAGKWDAKIKAKLTGQPLYVEDGKTAEAEVTAQPIENGGEESSDLSGVTETSSPSLIKDDETEQLKQTSKGNTRSEKRRLISQTDDVDIGFSTVKESADDDSQAVQMDTSSDTIVPHVAEAKEESSERAGPKEEEDIADSRPRMEEEEAVNEDKMDYQADAEEKEADEDEKEDKSHDDDEEADNEGDVPEITEAQNEPEAAIPEPEDENPASEEEQTHATRRSTRHQKSAASSTTLRKSRRQRRTSELDVQSPATEGENADFDDARLEMTQEDENQASSPAADATGHRRRKRKSSVVEFAESPRDRKRQRDESEPVDEGEPGQRNRRRGDRSEEQLALKKFQSVIGVLHGQITAHRYGNIFHNPIRPVEAPDYHDIVKRPMDLKTIKTRIRDGIITSSQEYLRDIYLMFANAIMYNRPGSDVYNMTEDMILDCENYISTHRQSEGFVRSQHRP